MSDPQWPTRLMVNETANNVAMMLGMMQGMPDDQVEYLFSKKLAYTMKAASEDMVLKASAMHRAVDNWYPGKVDNEK